MGLPTTRSIWGRSHSPSRVSAVPLARDQPRYAARTLESGKGPRNSFGQKILVLSVLWRAGQGWWGATIRSPPPPPQKPPGLGDPPSPPETPCARPNSFSLARKPTFAAHQPGPSGRPLSPIRPSTSADGAFPEIFRISEHGKRSTKLVETAVSVARTVACFNGAVGRRTCIRSAPRWRFDGPSSQLGAAARCIPRRPRTIPAENRPARNGAIAAEHVDKFSDRRK